MALATSKSEVNCCQWVTVHFAQGTFVLKSRFSLEIHEHEPCTHSRFIYFKPVHEQTNMESKTKKGAAFLNKSLHCFSPIT